MKKVFISYAHKDRSFRDELIAHLAPLKRRKVVDIWVDDQIPTGSS